MRKSYGLKRIEDSADRLPVEVGEVAASATPLEPITDVAMVLVDAWISCLSRRNWARKLASSCSRLRRALASAGVSLCVAVLLVGWVLLFGAIVGGVLAVVGAAGEAVDGGLPKEDGPLLATGAACEGGLPKLLLLLLLLVTGLAIRCCCGDAPKAAAGGPRGVGEATGRGRDEVLLLFVLT